MISVTWAQLDVISQYMLIFGPFLADAIYRLVRGQ
jgi:hypothetical protein